MNHNVNGYCHYLIEQNRLAECNSGVECEMSAVQLCRIYMCTGII